jgi:hypothetical protein
MKVGLMKHLTRLSMALVCLGALGSAVAAAATAPDVMGWWRMEAAIGAELDGQTIPDAAGGPTPRDGQARKGAKGSLRAYHELPGRYIYDPLRQQAVENRSSLRFATTSKGDGTGSSDYVEVDADLARTRPASFTVEGFIKNEGGVGKWHELIVLRDPATPHPHAWSLTTENLKGMTKLRYGGHRAPKGYWGNYTNNPSVTDAGWHHFAYVFDGSGDEPQARLYWDGQLVSQQAAPPPAYSDGQKLFIGGAPGSAGWNGYFDEVRYTAAALTPEQFLQASDTPGKPQQPSTPIALGLRTEPPKPLDQPVVLDLPAPVVGPAEVYVPADAGLIDVKAAYDAKGDGRTDDTAAIRRAVAENIGKHRTLYFPPGVYVLSEPIDWRNGKNEWNAFLTLQGAGMGRTFLYLRDESVAFGDPARPRAVTTSGSIPGRGSQADGGGNRAHNNYLMDLTIVVGKGNPGAIGLDFNASNTGTIENVRIVALGDAVEGLRLARQVGPLLVKNLEIHGFDVGIRAAGDLYGSTLTHIHLAGQKQVGLLNTGHTVALQNLVSNNRVPAIRSRGEEGRFANTGLLVLIDSQLTGGSLDVAAIESNTALFARGVETAGYAAAVRQADSVAVPTGRIEEYAWPDAVTLFNAPRRSLNLPAPQPPRLDESAPERWARVDHVPSAQRGKPVDQSQAIQKALDSGAAVVYLPQGTYQLSKPIVIRGNVRRVIGYNSWLVGESVERPAQIIFENAAPVSFERFNTRHTTLDVRSDQPITFKHLMSLPDVTLTHPKSTIFSENTVGGAIALFPGQSWHAWQLNIEKKGPPAMVENRGGTFWVLGYKTEQGNTVLRTTAGGRSEVLGGLWYPAQGVKDATMAAIETVDAHASGSFADVAKWAEGQYPIALRETRGGQAAELPREKLQRRWGLSGSISLYRSAGADSPDDH